MGQDSFTLRAYIRRTSMSSTKSDKDDIVLIVPFEQEGSSKKSTGLDIKQSALERTLFLPMQVIVFSRDT